MQSSFDWCLEIGFKAGVTDNLGRDRVGAFQDMIGRELAWEEQVYTATQHLPAAPSRAKPCIH